MSGEKFENFDVLTCFFSACVSLVYVVMKTSWFVIILLISTVFELYGLQAPGSNVRISARNPSNVEGQNFSPDFTTRTGSLKQKILVNF